MHPAVLVIVLLQTVTPGARAAVKAVEPPPAPVIVAPEPPRPELALADALELSGIKQEIVQFTAKDNLLAFLDKGRLSDVDVNMLSKVVKKNVQPQAFQLGLR